MHSTTLKIVLAGLVALAALAGCAPTTPRLDASFGDAVNTAKAQQTINPDASLNTDPVAGLGGQAANAVIDRYNKSYEKPPAPTNVFTIGVGDGSSTR
jgi:hypothetical protein